MCSEMDSRKWKILGFFIRHTEGGGGGRGPGGHFSPKNKCVLNDSKWPETHFGNFFFDIGHTFFEGFPKIPTKD